MNKIIKEKLNNIVREMIEEHEGGEEFFDNIDEKIKDGTIIDELIKNADYYDYDVIVVSGGFGRFFNTYYNGNKKVIVVNGSLRNDDVSIDDLSYYDLHGKEAIFIDDSFYLGRTRDKIEKELNDNSCELIQTIVGYDGSTHNHSDVQSLYRYYDNYKGDL